MSALLFAAGLAGPQGKVVVIDTERGRASLYSDNKRVMAALPQGYDVIELDQPYHPHRFVEALDVAEAGGYKVCLIDSESDSWDGPGGCADITEENKGRWNKAKLANKRMKTRISLSDMHVISLFKAQEKSKIIDKSRSGTGKEEVINLGVLPISEKNSFYPLLLGFSVDPKTHLSEAVKCHDDLAQFFTTPKLITKEDGEKVRLWNEGARAMEASEQLQKRARLKAEEGLSAYQEFFKGLSAAHRKALAFVHPEFKALAEKVDCERSQVPEFPDFESAPDSLTVPAGSRIAVGGKVYVAGENWQEVAA